VQSALMGVNAVVVGLLVAVLYDPVWTGTIHGTADFVLLLAAFGALAVLRLPPWLVGCWPRWAAFWRCYRPAALSRGGTDKARFRWPHCRRPAGRPQFDRRRACAVRSKWHCQRGAREIPS
jgi:hypothetical protein